MSNRNNAQITGDIVTQRIFLEEETISLTDETLSLVGTAMRGPAFVPQQVVSFAQDSSILNTWENIFGDFNFQKQHASPISSKVWLENNGSQLSYTRVLGVGDGSFTRDPATKEYDHAGFTVGNQIFFGPNEHAVADTDRPPGPLIPGLCYFEGKYVSEKSFAGLTGHDDQGVVYTSSFEDYFTQIGKQGETNLGIITNVIFAAQGIALDLQTDLLDELDLSQKRQELGTYQPATPGTIIESDISYPYIYIEGLSDSSKSIIETPLKTDSYKRFSMYEDKLNTSSYFNLNRGHLNYCAFRDIDLFDYPNEKTKKDATASFKKLSFITFQQASGQNVINYQSFKDVFRKAKTPWVVSQPVNTIQSSDTSKESIWKECVELFRFHTYSDGEEGNKYRFRITPKRLGNYNNIDPNKLYSKFDVEVFYCLKTQNRYNSIAKYIDLNLNPESDDYICKVIGTEHEYYDFDLGKIVTDGNYRKTNNHIYVEVTNNVEDKVIQTTLMPSGFKNYPVINTSNLRTNDSSTPIIQNPMRFAGNRQILRFEGIKPIFKEDASWGVLFDQTELTKVRDVLVDDENYNFIMELYNDNVTNSFDQASQYSKYFSSYRDEYSVWKEELDENTQYNFFHLEKILYNAADDINVSKRWDYSFYRRDGKDISGITSLNSDGVIKDPFKYVDINKLLYSNDENYSDNHLFLSFDFFSYGGFDGVNILDYYKKDMSGFSVARETNNAADPNAEIQTTEIYRTAYKIATEETDCRVDLFCMPGISSQSLIKEIVDLAETKRSFNYIFDVPEIITGSKQRDKSYYFLDFNNRPSDLLNFDETVKDELNDISNINETINNFKLMSINSKYSLALYNYCEAVVSNEFNVEIPPSTVYLKSLSKSQLAQPIATVNYDNTDDTLSVSSTLNMQFKFNCNNFDSLLKQTKRFDCSINPIGLMSQNRFVKPLSSNTLSTNNRSVFRSFHNIRIYHDITRNLRNILFTAPLINGSPMLFSPNTIDSNDNRVDVNLFLSLDEFMLSYVDREIINDYYVNTVKLNSERARQQKFRNEFSGEIGINFKGSQSSDLFNLISTNNLLNFVNNFEEDNNIIIESV